MRFCKKLFSKILSLREDKIELIELNSFFPDNNHHTWTRLLKVNKELIFLDSGCLSKKIARLIRSFLITKSFFKWSRLVTIVKTNIINKNITPKILNFFFTKFSK